MGEQVYVARERVTIVNQRGLHARASAKFVNAVAKLPAGFDVIVTKDGNEANGGSILGLMMLGAAKGDSVDLAVAGEPGEADAILMKLAGLIKDGFGED
jgi:phosphocarrier protein